MRQCIRQKEQEAFTSCSSWWAK